MDDGKQWKRLKIKQRNHKKSLDRSINKTMKKMKIKKVSKPRRTDRNRVSDGDIEDGLRMQANLRNLNQHIKDQRKAAAQLQNCSISKEAEPSIFHP